MGGFGMILGGALQGLGTGIAQQGAMEAQSRREIALQNLRAQQGREQATYSAQLADENNDRQAKREDWKDARSNDRRTTQQITVVREKGAIDTAQQRDKQAHETALEKQRQAGALTLEDRRSRNDITQAEYTSRLAEERDIRSSNREIQDILTLPNGQQMAVMKSGETRAIVGRNSRTGAKEYVLAKPDEEEGGGLLSGGRGIGGATRAVPAPAPAAAPVAARPAPAPAPARAQPARQQAATGAKTYTQAEARAEAERRGVPVETIHAMMRGVGYKLTGN